MGTLYSCTKNLLLLVTSTPDPFANVRALGFSTATVILSTANCTHITLAISVARVSIVKNSDCSTVCIRVSASPRCRGRGSGWAHIDNHLHSRGICSPHLLGELPQAEVDDDPLFLQALVGVDADDAGDPQAVDEQHGVGQLAHHLRVADQSHLNAHALGQQQSFGENTPRLHGHILPPRKDQRRKAHMLRELAERCEAATSGDRFRHLLGEGAVGDGVLDVVAVAGPREVLRGKEEAEGEDYGCGLARAAPHIAGGYGGCQREVRQVDSVVGGGCEVWHFVFVLSWWGMRLTQRGFGGPDGMSRFARARYFMDPSALR